MWVPGSPSVETVACHGEDPGGFLRRVRRLTCPLFPRLKSHVGAIS